MKKRALIFIILPISTALCMQEGQHSPTPPTAAEALARATRFMNEQQRSQQRVTGIHINAGNRAQTLRERIELHIERPDDMVANVVVQPRKLQQSMLGKVLWTNWHLVMPFTTALLAVVGIAQWAGLK